MDVGECVLSAGRAVLDMVEQEWQPLSPGELEQRLDQAVEEILEAELVARLRSQPPPTVYVQLLQNQANPGPQVPRSATDEETREPRVVQDPVDGEALKVPVRFSNHLLHRRLHHTMCHSAFSKLFPLFSLSSTDTSHWGLIQTAF